MKFPCVLSTKKPKKLHIDMFLIVEVKNAMIR